jgi:hypothetical protein
MLSKYPSQCAKHTLTFIAPQDIFMPTLLLHGNSTTDKKSKKYRKHHCLQDCPCPRLFTAVITPTEIIFCAYNPDHR